jgi:1-phosphofructokinase
MSEPVDVVTVTPSPAMDAGSGITAPAVLAAAGYRVAVTGWLDEAHAAAFAAFLSERGIGDHLVRVPGEVPPPAARSLLMERVLGLAAHSRWIVMGGVLPPGVDPGFYCELVTLVAGAGARVLVDTGGEPLRRALRSEPHVLAPSLAELQTLAGRALPARADAVAAARSLAKGETELVAVSLGAEGALFVTAERAVVAAAPSVQVGWTVTADEAMAAGIVAARIRGLALEETAGMAIAFVVAAVSGEPAERWLPQVTVGEAL